MRLLIAALPAVLATFPASAKEVIACRFPASPDVIIRLEDRKISGRMLNCIEGSFTHGVTSCAPNNAFSILPPDSDQPPQIVDRWQDHVDRDGAIVGSVVTSESIGFQGFSLFFGRPDANGSWKFVINRNTATAILTEGTSFHPPLTFTCARMTPKAKSG